MVVISQLSIEQVILDKMVIEQFHLLCTNMTCGFILEYNIVITVT